jgi:hypothetical protein
LKRAGIPAVVPNVTLVPLSAAADLVVDGLPSLSQRLRHR